MLCNRVRLCPKLGFRMLSMEKGRERRWPWLGCWAAAAAAAAAAAGRKGWKSSGGVGRVEADIEVAVGECDPEEAGDDGSGVSVTLISGLGGHDDIMAETSAEVSFSELGGLAGSTISMGRLSRLIMAEEGFPLLSYLSTRQRCPSVSVCWEIFYN